MLLKKTLATMIAGSLAAAMLLTACGGSKAPAASSAAPGSAAPAASKAPEVKYPKGALEFIAPAGAGGGFDVTIRTVAKVLQDNKLVTVPMPVTNKTGGGGGVALSYINEKKGNDSIVVVYSPPLMLINLTGTTTLGYKDTTPLARLITDYETFVVAKNSKYKSINEVMDALKKDIKSVKVAGNSAAGSLDHLAFLQVAKAAGVQNVKNIDFISFQDGSGPTQVLGGHVDLLSTGLADVKALVDSGDLVPLATTADKRVGSGKFADVPTCKEKGIDTVFQNWRGLFGAPGMPDYAVKYWQETLKKMSETEDWKKACASNGWDMVYADGDAYKKFLDDKNAEYTKLLDEIGMLKK